MTTRRSKAKHKHVEAELSNDSQILEQIRDKLHDFYSKHAKQEIDHPHTDTYHAALDQAITENNKLHTVLKQIGDLVHLEEHQQYDPELATLVTLILQADDMDHMLE